MKGFTIFFALLVSSIALSVGLAIYDLTVRELDLSGTATQSQYAVYSADTGAECALYWDAKCPSTLAYCQKSGGSAFATSTASGQPPASSNLLCNNQDISTLWGTPLKGANFATTTFSINVSNQTQSTATTTCATVEVGKFTDASGILYTTVVSHGYNTSCPAQGLTPAIVRVERTLQVSY
jgi:hypothetical protein